jgi:flagellar hook protein FlgE
MASFYIPLTGLNADSTALNTIANNLSNMNTTGFKSQSVNFSDLFYQQVGEAGSGDPIQRGSGTQVASIETDFSNGSPNTTNVDTNVALQGNGFFVVSNAGTNLLTRDGDFSLASNGNLITSNGLNVMGFPAVNGVVNTNASLAPINIPVGETESPSATTSFSITGTLNSAAPSDGTGLISEKVQVYDSLGKPYQATVTFTKEPTGWQYNIALPDTLPASSSTNATTGVTTINYSFGASGGNLATVDPGSNLTITGPGTGGVSTTINAPLVKAGESISAYVNDLQTALTDANINTAAHPVTATVTGGQLTISGANISTSGSVIQDAIASASANGPLDFDSNGNLVTPSTNVSGITFSQLSDGATSLNMTWDLFGAAGSANISQVDQTTTNSSTPPNGSFSSSIQDGYPTGNYTGFTIGSDGTVTATFNNGQKLNVGQLALGNVINLQGLQDAGNGDYSTTLASGTADIGVSGSAGLGTMQGGALEASNVNISAEFSDLIIAQRAFEANSKAVTTFDTITQETINMIH